MNTLVQMTTAYLEKTLGISAQLAKWHGYGNLPVFMQALYDYEVVNILDRPCLLLVSREEEEGTLAALRKHMALVQKDWNGAAIYVTRTMASNMRDRLIDNKIPFIVPGNQLYLPDLGLDMREHFKNIRAQRPTLSPATQLVVINALTTSYYGPLDTAMLTDRFGYTPMTFKRVFDEIEQFDLGVARTQGRKRVLVFTKMGRSLWEAALPSLKSPVKARKLAPRQVCEQDGFASGLTALSHYSMLVQPDPIVYAVGAEGWKSVKQQSDTKELSIADADACELEIWRYSPNLFAQTGYVDRLSLYLSLRGHSDERVEAALEEMMEAIVW